MYLASILKKNLLFFSRQRVFPQFPNLNVVIGEQTREREREGEREREKTEKPRNQERQKITDRQTKTGHIDK